MEQIAEVNRNLQISVFVIYILCAAGSVLMGWHIYTMNRQASQNRKALKLFLAVAVWAAGSACVGVAKDVNTAENMVHMSFAANALWLAWCPEYMMQSAFFDEIGKKQRVLYYVTYAASIVFVVSLFLKHEPGKFVNTIHGLAYVSTMQGLMKSYFVALFGMLVLIGMLIFPKMKTVKLKREKKIIYALNGAYVLLVIVTIIDFVIPRFGLIIIPVGAIVATVFLIILYKARRALDRMNITTEIASRHIYELIPMPLVIVRGDHTIAAINDYALQFFGQDRKETCEKPLEDYVGNAFFSLKKRFETEVRQGKDNYEVSVTCYHNKSVCGLKYNIIYDNYGEFSYALLQFTDMSKHYAMVHKLEESRNLAEVANEAKTRFLANMSHEIRTPLNVILGMNEMILREAGEPSIAEYSGNIKNAAESMVYMVNDILDMSKMESEKLEIISAEYDIKNMLKSIVKSTQSKAKAKNIQMICEIAPDLPCRLIGDETRIGQIISKFLSNAVKYTLSGKIILRIRGEVKDENSINMYIQVEDTGIGIHEEDFSKLFDTFSRVNLKENRTLSGLGLGLAIIKKVTEAMGGSVDVQSEYGKGSIFSVIVPQQFSGTEKVGDFNEWIGSLDVLAKGKEARRICAPDARILAVDDTSVNLEVVKALLKRTKMQIDTALSGADCLEMVKKKAYHVILMDHMMPEMDGVETLNNLKIMEDNLSKNATVIALTANAVSGAREFYLEKGFDDYLKKPVKSVELEKMLARYLPQELTIFQKEENAVLSGEEWAEKVRFDHIDVHKGLVYADNNPEILQGIMKKYLHKGKKHMDNIEQAYEKEDWSNYEILTHALKSTSSNIGAEKLSTHAKMLETAVVKEKFEYIKMNHRQVMELYEKVLEELDDYFAEMNIGEEEQKDACTEITGERLFDLMNILRDKLDIAITTDIEKVAAEMKKCSYKGIDLTETYHEIFTFIEEYEYEKAMTLVEEVIKSDV